MPTLIAEKIKNQFETKSKEILVKKAQFTMNSFQIRDGLSVGYTKINNNVGVKRLHLDHYRSPRQFIGDLKANKMERFVSEVALWNLFYGLNISKIGAIEVNPYPCALEPCIIMPHIVGNHAVCSYHWSFNSKKLTAERANGNLPLVLFLQSVAMGKGFFPHDTHGGNIIITKDKHPFLIDFEMVYMQFTNNRKFLREKNKVIEMAVKDVTNRFL